MSQKKNFHTPQKALLNVFFRAAIFPFGGTKFSLTDSIQPFKKYTSENLFDIPPHDKINHQQLQSLFYQVDTPQIKSSSISSRLRNLFKQKIQIPNTEVKP